MTDYQINGYWDGEPISRPVTSAEKLLKEVEIVEKKREAEKLLKSVTPPKRAFETRNTYSNIPTGYDSEGSSINPWN